MSKGIQIYQGRKKFPWAVLISKEIDFFSGKGSAKLMDSAKEFQMRIILISKYVCCGLFTLHPLSQASPPPPFFSWTGSFSVPFEKLKLNLEAITTGLKAPF